MSVRATVALAVGQHAGLVARYAGAGDRNMYWGRLTAVANGKVQAAIYRNVGGAWARLALKTLDGPGAGLLRFDVVGASLKLFLDGSLVAFAFDTKIAAPGSVGLRVGGGAAAGDFFAAAVAGPASQPLPFDDAFDAAGAGNQLSGDWRDRVGNFGVQSGRAVGQAAGTNVATVNGLALADGAVQAAVALGPVGQAVGLVARYGGPDDRNMYVGSVTALAGGNVQFAIRRNLGGTWKTLATTTLPGGVSLLRFALAGPALTLSADGAAVLTATDAAIAGPGAVGIRVSRGAGADNFRAGQ